MALAKKIKEKIKEEENKKKSKGLTLTIIFLASSLNYGEGLGNISTLKKITRGNGEIFTYLSRQGLGYNVKQKMGVDTTPIGLDKTVLQFSLDSTIEESEELDLFGYMKTVKNGDSKKRNAVVRLSNAISLEPFAADMDFLTNLGLFNRYNSQNVNKKDGPNISQSEKHMSFYTYTVTIDLDKVGIDENDKDSEGKPLEVSNEEKYNRIKKLLDALKFLSRQIKGTDEQLMPLFMIGGVYDIKNPFFLNGIKLDKNFNINVQRILDILDMDDNVKENTKCGFISGSFNNEDEITKELKPISIRNMMDGIKKEVKAYYTED